MIFALLDDGSTVTIINRNIVKYLELECVQTNVALKVVGQNNPLSVSNEKANLEIECNSKVFPLKNVLLINNLELSPQTLPKFLTDYLYSKTNIRIEPYCNAIPELIIGQDCSNLIVTREFFKIPSSSLFISYCLLGWSLHGKALSNFEPNSNLVNNYFVNNLNSCDALSNLDEAVKQYFTLEAIGVSSIPRVSTDDKRALNILNETSRRVGNAWEVGLLWKGDDLYIPFSRSNAENRLRILERKLDKDPEYAELYYKEMDRLIEKGFAIKINELPQGRIWYLPHFGVKNANKPGRIRLVFDAAAKCNSVSFNDLLLTGPDLLKNLIGVFMRFRQRKIAIKGDLRDMFLKIKIISKDRDAQRFLWRRDDRLIKPQEYVMTSVLFGARSSPCAALYIKDKNAKTFEKKYPEAVKGIIKNSYMDDYLDSCNTEGEAEARIRQVIEINKAADWEMHGWASNKNSVLKQALGKENPLETINLVDSKKDERILGIHWQTDLDVFIFQLNSKKIPHEFRSGSKIPTKREFLSVIMSIFDPLGFLSPFTIRARVLMQDVWLSKINWDEKLKDEEFNSWLLWIQDLKRIEKFEIPRCYSVIDYDVNSVELHTFCDASEKAYAAVAYWRFELSSGIISTSIVIAKSRVAPSKSSPSIPRLELQAAVLGVRLAKTVIAEHDFKVKRRVFWSDSRTVLHWLKSDPRKYNTFVMNRLGEICDESNFEEWRWVPTSQNPADDATRLAPDALNKNSRWLIGPQFLRSSETSWPKVDESSVEINLDLNEYKRRQVKTCATTTVDELPSCLPIYTRFSTWNRLIRVTARVLEATDLWLLREPLISSLERFEKAEKLWLNEIQVKSFRQEILELKNSDKISKTSRIKALSPFLDKGGLLRVEGRVKFLPGTFEKFQPVILDAKHYVTKLLISHYHEKFYHKNHETVINEIRQKFWIIGLRRILRSIVSQCGICKLMRAAPPSPRMSDLPPARLGYRLHPFTHCGLDYFGPLHVKIGRRREKRWGVLLTCMTTRAIHIELAHTLSSDSTIMAIRRFASRRGFPLVLYSDNGTNFKGACQELKEVIANIDKNKQLEFANKNKFEWKFNPPSASHMGGAWERLIRSVKESLNLTMRDNSFKEETLQTILAEIEHTLNSRPLTHVSPDPRDLEALTPNHFLLGSSSGSFCFDRFTIQLKCTRKQWELAQYYAEIFWKRWLHEYLPSLIPRKKWQNRDNPLKVGDLVLIIDEQTPRNVWRKAIVSAVFPSSDGEVRVAEVKTSNGVFKRPTRKLIKFSEVQNA